VLRPGKGPGKGASVAAADCAAGGMRPTPTKILLRRKTMMHLRSWVAAQTAYHAKMAESHSVSVIPSEIPILPSADLLQRNAWLLLPGRLYLN
jgi:hypothetical protein